MNASDFVLHGKVIAALTAIALLWVPWKKPFTLSDAAFDRACLSALAISRLLAYFVLFLALGVSPMSDVLLYHADGNMALEGLVPYRDFSTAYGPLFSRLMALPLLVWNSPKALVLVFIVCEILSFPIWLQVGRRLFPERRVREAALLYTLSCLPFLNVAIMGQNNSAISLLLAVSILALLNGREFLSGLVLGISLVGIKVLGLFFAPVVFWAARRKFRWSVGFLLPLLPTYAWVTYQGADFLFPLRAEALRTVSGNFIFFLSLLGVNPTSDAQRQLWNLVGILALCVIFAVAALKRRRDADVKIPELLVLVFLVLMLVNRKAAPYYWITCFFPFCLTFAPLRESLRGKVALSVFTFCATLDLSLWFRWIYPHDLSLLFFAPLPAGIPLLHVWLFALVDGALALTYFALFAHTWKRLCRSHP